MEKNQKRFEWTFFGLDLFAAINLFLCGAYLLAEAIRDPLEASEAGVIAAGFTLALASFLLTYLVWPRAKYVFGRDPDPTKCHKSFTDRSCRYTAEQFTPR